MTLLTRLMRLASIAALSLFLFAPQLAAAQAYPTKAIRLIVPFPPGGTTDIVARLVADKLSQQLGQPVVVDNRAGAGGSIGADLIAKAPPDGYTLGIATVSTHAVNPAANAKTPYNPITDFIPITNLAAVPNVIEVHPSVPVKDLKEFIAMLKREPGKWSFASSGQASIGQMMGELFLHSTGTDMVHVPYKGAGPAINDMLGGHVSMIFSSLPPTIGNIKAGTLRALGTCALRRAPMLPEVPTMEEVGFKDFEAEQRYGLIAPAGTPDQVLRKLNQSLRAALGAEDVKERIAADGAVVNPSTPEEYATDIDREEAKWAKVVQLAKAPK